MNDAHPELTARIDKIEERTVAHGEALVQIGAELERIGVELIAQGGTAAAHGRDITRIVEAVNDLRGIRSPRRGELVAASAAVNPLVRPPMDRLEGDQA